MAAVSRIARMILPMPFSVDAGEFLKVTEPALRQGSAAALAKAVASRWTPQQLCSLLHHPNADVRRVVAVTLGLVGDRRVVPCLAEALHDDDEQVNQMAEHGLWAIWFRMGDDRAAQPFREGVALLASEAYQPAVERFGQATCIDPRFAEAFNQCAIAHFFLSQWPESMVDCRKTVRLMPQHFGAIAGIGHCYLQMGDLSRALQCYRRSLRINPRMGAVARAVERLESRLGRGNDASGQFLVDGTLLH